MVSDVVKQAADRPFQLGKRDSNLIRIREVTASRGKVMRAEPISLLSEKGKVLMRRGLEQLEGEMLSLVATGTRRSTAHPTDWTPLSGSSPDSLASSPRSQSLELRLKYAQQTCSKGFACTRLFVCSFRSCFGASCTPCRSQRPGPGNA
jgi:hypothetical protein